MRGYKLVYDVDQNKKCVYNQCGTPYELNREYELSGELKYSKNGFHFSIYPEETLRFRDRSNGLLASDFTIVEIEADGKIECGDDYLENEKFDTIGVYASSRMTVLRILPREEVFNIILNSKNPLRMRKYIMFVKLTTEEIDLVKEYYNDFCTLGYIGYYQYNDEKAFEKAYTRTLTY